MLRMAVRLRHLILTGNAKYLPRREKKEVNSNNGSVKMRTARIIMQLICPKII